MKPLSPQDQIFLWLERRNQPMHVGGLQLLTLPKGAGPDFVSKMVERAKQYVQAEPPFNQRLSKRLGRFFWTDDTEFDLEAHFRHLALPAPGRIRELLSLVSKMHSNLLDRERPLWEFYIIEGIEGNRVALYSKIHHALVDGVAAMRMLQRAMSEDAEVEVVPIWAQPPKKREPRSLPNPVSVMGGALGEMRDQISTIPTVARELYRSIKDARENPDYVSVFQAPRSILNQRISGSRRFAAQSWALDRIKAAGKKHKATLNDIVLAMCATALRRYLLDMDALPVKPLIAMVPMSLRKDDSDEGNQVAMILANLATHLDDPIERLEAIQRSVQTSKDRYGKMNQKEIINYLSAVMAPSGLNMVTGIAPKWQSYNVIISNVPGPKKTLYFNGAKMEGMYPVSIVLDGFALNITLNSYVDKLEFGLIACRRTLPSMQRLLDDLEQGLKELE